MNITTEKLKSFKEGYILDKWGMLAIKDTIKIQEELDNTPEMDKISIWPEKKEVTLVPINQQGVVIGFYEKDGKDCDVSYNRAIDECKSAAMKGCPCCGVTRIIEKQKERERR